MCCEVECVGSGMLLARGGKKWRLNIGAVVPGYLGRGACFPYDRRVDVTSR